MSDPAAASPAPSTASFIRACQNCQKSKAKCAPQSASSSARCMRCERLGKECLAVPKTSRKRRAPNTTTAKLEQKIESLVNLLSNAQGVNQQLTPPRSLSQDDSPGVAKSIQPNDHHPEVNVNQEDGHFRLNALAQATLITRPFQEPSIPWTSLSSAPPTSPKAIRVSNAVLCKDIPAPAPRQHFSSSTWHLSDPEGKILVTKFKDVFLPHFPFIPIPDMTTADFKSKRPHLLKAIWTIAFQDNRKRQIEMGKDLMVDISTSMLARGEKDLDMLQSLILMNAWSYFVSPVPPSTKSTLYYQLALALLYDLRLTKPMRESDGTDILVDFRTKHKPDSVMNDTAKRSSDECRALLCCFYIGSTYALSIRRTEGLSFSSYIDFCCQTLEERAECESDFLLVALVRMECLIQPIDQLLSKKAFIDEYSAPVTMHIKSMRTSLDKLYNDLPPSTKQNQLMILSYHSNSIYVYEPAFYSSLFPTTPFSPTTSRLDLLHACLQSSKALFDNVLALPLPHFYGTSLIDLGPLGRACTSLLRLCLLEDEPGWELPLTRQDANLIYYLETVYRLFVKIGSDLDGRQRHGEGEGVRKSFFTGSAAAVGVIKGWYEMKVAQEMGTGEGSGIRATGMGYDASWIGTGGILDEAYWTEFMGDWTLQ